jgi:hypothetical protein
VLQEQGVPLRRPRRGARRGRAAGGDVDDRLQLGDAVSTWAPNPAAVSFPPTAGAVMS